MYGPPAVSRELARDAYDGRNSFSKYTPHCDNVDGVTIDKLVDQYGSPLFVFSEKNNTRDSTPGSKGIQRCVSEYSLWLELQDQLSGSGV